MKISTKGRYGLRILLDLAQHDGSELRMIRDIAASQQISEKYISRLIIALRRGGLVKSVRGAKGGYRLAGKPEEITLLEILETMEGPLAIVDCAAAPGGCDRSSGCPACRLWTRLNGAMRELLGSATLAELLSGKGDPDCF